jgi:MFS family permease
MATLDIVLIVFIAAALAAFTFIIWSYVKGLKGSPRELWLLYTAKVIEYGSYGAANMAFILYLSADCGLGDISAGTYIGIWSMTLTVCTMLVGAVCDAIGVKRTLVLGTAFLLFARFVMPLTSNLWIVSLMGFLPMAVGTAVVGPVMSVGIKRYTTKEGATLGFGLLYTMFNVGWALGGLIFDWVRGWLGEHEIVSTPIGVDMSTYQVIFAISFLLTIPTMLLFLFMRTGVERLDTGEVVVTPPVPMEGNVATIMGKESSKAAKDTIKIFGQVVREKAFWYFIFMLGLLVFVRLVFYHFHYTWPKYGIRVLGEGVKIGNIYGVLNPLMIVFLVPFIAALTKKVSSYKMMMVGTTISALAVFIATMPPEFFEPLMHTWVAELIFVKWLAVPVEMRDPLFLCLVSFIIVFTIGEALWSPRLMQFTAEIAPKGKEGSYIALSYLPYFGAKLIAGPMSGWLVATYVPKDAENYDNHYMVWVWIGCMAAISPIGLLLFRKLFRRAERERAAEDEAERLSLLKKEK